MNGMAQAFGIGTMIGIGLFFVLAYYGLIDKLLYWIEKR
jgi:hypothetical protein